MRLAPYGPWSWVRVPPAPQVDREVTAGPHHPQSRVLPVILCPGLCAGALPCHGVGACGPGHFPLLLVAFKKPLEVPVAIRSDPLCLQAYQGHAKSVTFEVEGEGSS